MNKTIFLFLTLVSFTKSFCAQPDKNKEYKIDSFIFKYTDLKKPGSSFSYTIVAKSLKISDIKEHLSKNFSVPKEKIKIYKSLVSEQEMGNDTVCDKKCSKCLIVFLNKD